MIFSQVNKHVQRYSDQQLFFPDVAPSRIFGCMNAYKQGIGELLV